MDANEVVGEGGMGNHVLDGGHVARDTIVLVLSPPRLLGNGAIWPLVAVALKAALAVILDLFRGVRQFVRIVARDTAHLTIALYIALADDHLLDLANRPLLRRIFASGDKDGQELVERQPGAILSFPC